LACSFTVTSGRIEVGEGVGVAVVVGVGEAVGEAVGVGVEVRVELGRTEGVKEGRGAAVALGVGVCEAGLRKSETGRLQPARRRVSATARQIK
jgi:hypothetical protein